MNDDLYALTERYFRGELTVDEFIARRDQQMPDIAAFSAAIVALDRQPSWWERCWEWVLSRLVTQQR